MTTEIYERVKALCAERGISVKALSLAAGLHEQTVHRWKRVKGVPQDITVSRVASILGVSTDYIRYGEERTHGEETFPQRLKALRLGRGMSQSQLAAEIYCSESTVGNWENEWSAPSDDYIHTLADYFGVSYAYLVGVD